MWVPSPPAPDNERALRGSYLSEDTIAALATGGGGAVAIVRVSGPSAFTVARSLAVNPDRVFATPPRTLVRTTLLDQKKAPLDDALIVRFISPESYTGEDVIEFHLHGSRYITSRLLEELSLRGVRQALPGEFSFRAVRNGKLSLSQAQAVADLITAKNGRAVSLAIEKLSGAQSRLLTELADGLRSLAVLSEASIDFSDQDIEDIRLSRLQERVSPILRRLEALHASFDRGSRIQNGIHVAFVGLPNAGKSSFFNALLGEDRSIVTEYAGTTRDIIREHLTLRGKSGDFTLRLEDTAGLRPTHDPVEKIGVDRTLTALKEADLVLFLVDPTQSLSEAKKQWQGAGAPDTKCIGIITKSDLSKPIKKEEIAHQLAELGVASWIETSAQTQAGIPEAIQAITSACEQWFHRDEGEVLLTRLDHLSSVSGALGHLTRALTARESDLFAADLRQALHALGPLIGETPADDILGKIFSEFCIGK